MFNAVNKFIPAAILLVVAVSCGDSQRDEAVRLSQEAENEVKAGRYEEAVALLDTLDNKYASQVEVRRSAMKFRAMAVEGITLHRITAVDDTLAHLKASIEESEKQFEYVPNPGKGLGGNYVSKALLKSTSPILPRINDEDYFTLSVKILGKNIGFECVSFVDGQESVSTRPIDASRLVSVEGHEMTVLQQEDVADAIEWLAVHPSASAYRLVGSKSTVDQKMSADFLDAIVQTWAFARDKQAYRLALIEREKLERRLQLCRDQLANVIDR